VDGGQWTEANILSLSPVHRPPSTQMHITFLAHGSRKPESNQYFYDLIKEISDSPNINLGFLELVQPDIQTAIQNHIQNGAKKIHVIPLFFSPGRHVTEDIPKIINELSLSYPDVEIVLEDIIGIHPEFKKLVKSLAENILH